MKINLRSFLRLGLILFFLPFTASKTFAQYTAIPDANFEQKLIDLSIDSEGTLDGQLLTSDAHTVTNLNISNEFISDLTGIEDFINLTDLNCMANNLTSLDFSANTQLENLNCDGNLVLTSINLTNCTALLTLSVSENDLSSIDISDCTNLTTLDCGFNQLTTLDVSQNTALTVINCYLNLLTSIDLSNCTLLQHIDCQDNLLSALDVSNNTMLNSLGCNFNQISTLDVSNNTALTYLDCGANQLSNLNLSNNTALDELICSENQISSLDLSNNTNLAILFCSDNQLSSLDVRNGNNTIISTFNALLNNLTCIDVDDPAYSTTNWTDIDMGVVFATNCNPLPVELLSFNVQSKDNQSLLHWQTASETNNQGFEIQHSINAGDWQPIGFVKGKGNTLIKNNYSFVHVQPQIGTNFYRLKQIDYDGAYQYSEVEVVNNHSDQRVQVYPNPGEDIFYLNGAEDGEVIIQNQLGMTIHSGSFQNSTLNLSHLPKGVYFIQITSKNQMTVHRVIKY